MVFLSLLAVLFAGLAGLAGSLVCFLSFKTMNPRFSNFLSAVVGLLLGSLAIYTVQTLFSL